MSARHDPEPRRVSRLTAMIRNGVALAALLLCACAQGQADAGPAPGPELSPAEVVQAQLDALADNDTPTEDAGMARVFAFASPGNRAQTGPLARFAAMIRGGYGAMVNNRGASIEDVAIDGDQALVATRVVAADGRVFTYVFILARGPHEGCAGCWMTDGVVDKTTPGKEIAT